MDKHQLGNSDLWVSRLGLGCMGMSSGYGTCDDGESVHFLKGALDAGVNFLDTADQYGIGVKGWGHNETLIGNVLAGSRRQRVVLATKCGFVDPGQGTVLDGAMVNATPAHMRSACDASLRRLKTDVIDLYYLHRAQKDVPIEESVGALADLVKAGKVRFIGLSEVTPATLQRAHKVHPITALQSEYSLFHRKPEKEILSTCRALGVAFVAYCPLGRGFLTGKYRDISALEEGDYRRLLPKYTGDNYTQNIKIVDAVGTLARQKGCTPAQLALAWLMAQGQDVFSIPGTRSLERLKENLGATQVVLTRTELDKIDRAIPLGAAQGEQYPALFDFEV
ncbi:MAG: aldo/keto reductase [Candidatus Puniceispirillum sp.]|nr:aldo/keto reductase [Candidatus Puniceispirillum sp.]